MKVGLVEVEPVRAVLLSAPPYTCVPLSRSRGAVATVRAPTALPTGRTAGVSILTPVLNMMV